MPRVVAIPPYLPAIVPTDSDDLLTFLGDDLRKVSVTIAALIRQTPQPATSAPKLPADGMQRLARAPWWPAAGQVADAWVYYDAPTTSWKLL